MNLKETFLLRYCSIRNLDCSHFENPNLCKKYDNKYPCNDSFKKHFENQKTSKSGE